MDETALAQVRIVLVRPIGPLNVGSVARVMKNMGLSKLVLVAPQCDRLGEEARQMAIHAADILEAAQEVATVAQALKGCQLAIATTARDRKLSLELEEPRIALPSLLQQLPSALIFGPEDTGLSNDDLKYAQRFLRIPTSDSYPALNLAQAVAVCCYELFQYIRGAAEQEGNNISDVSPLSSAPLHTVEEFYGHLETVLLKIGYLYPHTAAARMAKFRLLFNRAHLSPAEVAMLRGIFSQMEWFISQKENSVTDTPLSKNGV